MLLPPRLISSPTPCPCPFRPFDSEHVNLKSAMPDVWSRLSARLVELSATVYQTAYAEPNTTCIATPVADAMYRGFMGPQCFKHIPPTPPAPPTPPSPPASPTFAIAKGDSCLVPQEAKEMVSVVLEACDETSAGWETVPSVDNWVRWSKGAFYIKLNETDDLKGGVERACVRGEVYINNNDDPPRAGCDVCQGFSFTPSGTLASSACSNQCLVANSSHPVAHIGSCSSEDAVWTRK